jgi:hypothetical protein
MAPYIHPFVQDATGLDEVLTSDSIQEKMTSATSMRRDVQRADAGHKLVAGPGPGQPGTVCKFTDRLHERVAINPGLSRSEIVLRPLKNVRKVELCGRAKANLPFWLGHEAQSVSRTGNDLFGKVVQIRFEVADAVEFLELAAIQRIESDARRLSQDLQLRRILCFALLHEP